MENWIAGPELLLILLVIAIVFGWPHWPELRDALSPRLQAWLARLRQRRQGATAEAIAGEGQGPETRTNTDEHG